MLRVVVAIALAACSGPARPAQPLRARCVLAAAITELRHDGGSILERWDLAAAPSYESSALPDDAAYAAYRTAIVGAHGDQIHPIADAPEPQSEAARAVWRREDQNLELAYSGRGGTIRPINCLEALLFARQNARFSELAHPTELVASILRLQGPDGPRLRIYFGASDVMFPPKSYYGFEEVKADVAAGWQWVTMLHDHTVRTYRGQPALGVTAPSTNDVQLVQNLAEDGLQSARVTNGFYTIDIPASAFALYTP